MHWRRSTWALVIWTALTVVWLITSATATASDCTETGGSSDECGHYAQVAILAVLSIWLVVALPLGAYWYTRRKTGDGEAQPLDPMDHWPPPPR
jgi:membrane protein YdbS with pleckstrin-like domain